VALGSAGRIIGAQSKFTCPIRDDLGVNCTYRWTMMPCLSQTLVQVRWELARVYESSTGTTSASSLDRMYCTDGTAADFGRVAAQKGSAWVNHLLQL
jgi:hypothetical protein